MQEQISTNQITSENYHDKVGKFTAAMPKEDRQKLPTITLDSAEFRVWMQYFDRHLRWRPASLKMLLLRQMKAMTVPTQWPQWFDSAFVEDPGWKPAKPSEATYQRPSYQDIIAKARTEPDEGIPNVFVGTHVPQYADMVDRHKRTEGRWSSVVSHKCLDGVVREGLLVPRKWLGVEKTWKRGTFSAPSDAWLRDHYAAGERSTA